jgi:ATP/maltotriose-dependent transcriptional regulator MalT
VDIVAMMVASRTNQEIAGTLGISAATGRSHTIRIFRNLGVSDRRDVVAPQRAADWLPA